MNPYKDKERKKEMAVLRIIKKKKVQEEKDYSKPINKLKDMLMKMKKDLSTVQKSHAKMEKQEKEEHDSPSPEDHQSALNHFKSQYINAKRNKDEAAATDAARGYHDYSNKLSKIYQKKLKESNDICPECMQEPCVCGGNHIEEGKMGEKAAGDLDFHDEASWVKTGKTATHTSGKKTHEWAKVDKEGKRTGERHYRTADGKVMGEEVNMQEQHLVHVDDGSKYGDKPHPEDQKHVMAGVEKHKGEFDGTSDKGAYFKFKSQSDARAFKRHVDSCPKRTCHADLQEEVRQVNEISKELANRYMHSAFSDRGRTDEKMLDLQNKQKEGGKFFRSHKKISKLLAKSDKRTTGIGRALVRITKEEAEQVDELNVMTLSRYASKARSQSMDKDNPKRYKRGSGAAKAYDKIHRGEYSEGRIPEAKETHAKPVPKKPADEYDRKVTSYLKKKYQKEEVEQFDEAVSVDKKTYSWGKMMTVHHGKDTSYPLHPEHQAAIKKLRSGDKTSFKDETGRRVHAHREGDQVHLVSHGAGGSKTTIGYHHFEENVNPYKLHEIKMSDKEYASNVQDYGKRATDLLKHSWSQHDVSQEKKKAGDKPGAEKAASTSSRAHKLFLKAKERHLKNPKNAEHFRNKIMSGASDYYKSKKPGEYTGD